MSLPEDTSKGLIGVDALASSGKLNPAQAKGKKLKKKLCPDCGRPLAECECEEDDDEGETGWSEPSEPATVKKSDDDGEDGAAYGVDDGDFGFYVPLLKSNVEQRTVTGVVLVPEEVDAQGDVYDAEVIRKAAYGFLATFNVDTTLGMMHKDMSPPFTLCESYLAPCQLMIGTKTVKQGTWIITVRVNDDKIWAMCKSGKITGFSIGGVAKVKKIETVTRLQNG